MLNRAWRLLLHKHPNRQLEALVGALGAQLGWESIGETKYQQERLSSWFSGTELAHQAFLDFDAQRGADLSGWLDTVEVPESSNVGKAIWRELLLGVGRDLLLRLDHAVLIAPCANDL